MLDARGKTLGGGGLGGRCGEAARSEVDVEGDESVPVGSLVAINCYFED